MRWAENTGGISSLTVSKATSMVPLSAAESIANRLRTAYEIAGLPLLDFVIENIVPVLPAEYGHIISGTKFGVGLFENAKHKVEQQRLFNCMFALYFSTVDRVERASDYTFEQLKLIEDDLRFILRQAEERKARLILEILEGVLDPRRKMTVEKHDMFKRWVEQLDLTMIGLLMKIDFETKPSHGDWLEVAMDAYEFPGWFKEHGNKYAALVRSTLEGLGMYKLTTQYHPRNAAQNVLKEWEARGKPRQYYKRDAVESNVFSDFHPYFGEFVDYLKNGMDRPNLDELHSHV
jgi:hypothetical protein